MVVLAAGVTLAATIGLVNCKSRAGDDLRQPLMCRVANDAAMRKCYQPRWPPMSEAARDKLSTPTPEVRRK